jgi:hypothetical protein
MNGTSVAIMDGDLWVDEFQAIRRKNSQTTYLELWM